MATSIGDITDGELPRILSGLGQTSSGRVFDDGQGTVTVLSQGVKAPRQIKQMQMLLNQFGYKLTTDGIFGAGSTAAVKAIQTKLSMSATGVYDKALDERITGMNQSGIIDATANDQRVVAQGEKAPQSGSGTTATPAAGTGLTLTPVVSIAAQNAGAMTPAGPSFMDSVKSKWAIFMAKPNAKYYLAGAAVFAVTGMVIVGGTSVPSAQVSGYRKSRKSRR